MKSIKTQLISIATILVLGTQASAALAKTPSQNSANNIRHAQSVGGDSTPLHTAKNNIRYAQNADVGFARSPAKSQKNNVYKQVMNNGK